MRLTILFLFVLFCHYALAQSTHKVIKAKTGTITVKGDSTVDLARPIRNSDVYEAPRKTKEDSKNEIFIAVEQMPEFPGGENAMLDYLAKNIIYPKEAIENKIEGIIYIEFVVNQDGSIEQSKIVREIGSGCGVEAERVIKTMPKWRPGRNNGMAVRTLFTLPVSFQLAEE